MEELQLNIFGIISLFGAFQGLILALIFALNKSFSKTSNWFLSLLLLTFSMANFWGALEEIEIFYKYPILRFIPLVWSGLIGPTTYFFIKFLTNPNYKTNRWEYLMFIPFLLDALFKLYYLYLFKTRNLDLETDLEDYYFFAKIFEIIAIILAMSVLFIGVKTLREYENKLYGNFADISDRSLKWLTRLLIGGGILSLVWLRGTVAYFFMETDINTGRSIWMGVSVLIYWVGYGMLIQRELFMNEEMANLEEVPEEISKLSDRTADHYKNLLAIMQEKELFRDTNLNMSKLAKEVGLSKGYLSQIINQKEEKNFFDFINAYRVTDVKKKMNDPSFAHYSILGIALEAGFKSKSTFNSVFKKMTGLTPSQFKKQ